MKKDNLVRLIDVLVILMTIAAFTPLIIPSGRSGPMLEGIPYTMWMGFLISTIYVILAYLISRIKNTKRS